MTENRLEQMQRSIGQEFSEHPSPMGAWLRPVIRKAELGTLSFQYTVRPEMTNPAGTLHGGAIAAMLDDTIGATLITSSGEFYASINLVVDYFASARSGEVVVTESHIVKQGKTIANVECTLTSAEGKPLARGVSNAIRVNLPI